MGRKSLSLSLLLAIAACSEGEKCVGGLVTDGGECVAKCDPDLCVVHPGDGGPVLTDGGVPVNACVDNMCMLRCSSHYDCTVPAESCLTASEDDTGNEVFVCQNSPLPEGVLDPCPFGDVGEHADECPPDLQCIVEREGDADAYCAQPGCVTDDDCAAGFYCGAIRDPHRICGTLKGENAFCGRTDQSCTSDDHCGEDQKCDTDIGRCCIEPASLSEDGPMLEGPLCAMKRVCLKRGPCTECETDIDCSYTSTKCTEIDGEQRCAMPCTKESETFAVTSVVPYPTNIVAVDGDQTASFPEDSRFAWRFHNAYNGTWKVLSVSFSGGKTNITTVDPMDPAGAAATGSLHPIRECPLDQECKDGFCVPLAGACPDEDGRFCDPCIDDLDCGNASNGWVCDEIQIGQKVCLDYGTTCSSGAQCSSTPVMGQGICWYADSVQPPAPEARAICNPDLDVNSGFFTCW